MQSIRATTALFTHGNMPTFQPYRLRRHLCAMTSQWPRILQGRAAVRALAMPKRNPLPLADGC